MNRLAGGALVIWLAATSRVWGAATDAQLTRAEKSLEEYRHFALLHEGDQLRGKAIFADDPFVSRYLNEIRYDEMFHLGWIGSRLDELQNSKPEVGEWREQARDYLAATLRAYEVKVDAAARKRMAAAS